VSGLARLVQWACRCYHFGVRRWAVILILGLLTSVLVAPQSFATERFSVAVLDPEPANDFKQIYVGQSFETQLVTGGAFAGSDWVRLDVGAVRGSEVEIPNFGRVRAAIAVGPSLWRIGLTDGLYLFDGTALTLVRSGSFQPVSEQFPLVAAMGTGSRNDLVEVADDGTLTDLDQRVVGLPVSWKHGVAYVTGGHIKFHRLDGGTPVTSTIEVRLLNAASGPWRDGVIGSAFDAENQRYLFYASPQEVVRLEGFGRPGLPVPVDETSFVVFLEEGPLWRGWLDGHVEQVWFDAGESPGFGRGARISSDGTELTMYGAQGSATVGIPARVAHVVPVAQRPTRRSIQGSPFGDLNGEAVPVRVPMNPSPNLAAWSPDLQFLFLYSFRDGAFVVDVAASNVIGPISTPGRMEAVAWDPSAREFMTVNEPQEAIPFISRIGTDGSITTRAPFVQTTYRKSDVGSRYVLPGLSRDDDLVVSRVLDRSVGILVVERVLDGRSTTLPGWPYYEGVQDRIGGTQVVATGNIDVNGLHVSRLTGEPAVVSTVTFLAPPNQRISDFLGLAVDEVSGVAVVGWSESVSGVDSSLRSYKVGIVELDTGEHRIYELGFSSARFRDAHVVAGGGTYEVAIGLEGSDGLGAISIVRGLYDGALELVDNQISDTIRWNVQKFMAGRTPTGELAILEWSGPDANREGLVFRREPGARGIDRAGYWLATEAGQFVGFGDIGFETPVLGAPIAGITANRGGSGVWAVRPNGQVLAIAAAPWFGDAPLQPGDEAVAVASTPTNNGYWVFSAGGRVYNFGDAPHFGDLGAIDLAGPVLGALATSSGAGYYMVGSDGGVFAFGDASFLGSVPQILPGVILSAPIVGIAPTADGTGYWLVAADGGVFSFSAPFRGSIPAALPGVALNEPVNSMVPYGNGYLLVAADGGVFNFSNLSFDGSLGASPLESPIVGIAPFDSSR